MHCTAAIIPEKKIIHRSEKMRRCPAFLFKRAVFLPLPQLQVGRSAHILSPSSVIISLKLIAWRMACRQSIPHALYQRKSTKVGLSPKRAVFRQVVLHHRQARSRNTPCVKNVCWSWCPPVACTSFIRLDTARVDRNHTCWSERVQRGFHNSNMRFS